MQPGHNYGAEPGHIYKSSQTYAQVYYLGLGWSLVMITGRRLVIITRRSLVIVTGRSLVIFTQPVGCPGLLSGAGAEPGHNYGAEPGHNYEAGPGRNYGAEPGHILAANRMPRFIIRGWGGAWS